MMFNLTSFWSSYIYTDRYIWIWLLYSIRGCITSLYSQPHTFFTHEELKTCSIFLLLRVWESDSSSSSFSLMENYLKFYFLNFLLHNFLSQFCSQNQKFTFLSPCPTTYYLFFYNCITTNIIFMIIITIIVGTWANQRAWESTTLLWT